MLNYYDAVPNAKKWTTEVVTELLLKIEADANDGDSLFLSKALSKQGLYRHVWTYWKKSFSENDDIAEMMLRIESTFEAKLLQAALKKELSPWLAIMTLKHSYNWKDKPKGTSSRPVLFRDHQE